MLVRVIARFALPQSSPPRWRRPPTMRRAGAGGPAPPRRPPASARPALIVAISVDQFSADLFAAVSRPLSPAGSRGLQEGAVFPSGYQSHAATETCPGHSTILTGARPARTGIIANNWFDLGRPRADKAVYCAEDESDPRQHLAGPCRLGCPPQGADAGRPDEGGRTRTAATSRYRARTARVMMMGGHAIDAGLLVEGQRLSPACRARARPARRTPRTPRSPPSCRPGAPAMPLPAWCAPRDQAVPVGAASVGTRPLRARRRQADRFPRLAAARRGRRRSGDRGWSTRLKLGQGPRARRALGQLFRNRLCRPCARHRGRRDVHPDGRARRSDRPAARPRSTRAGIDYVVVLTADHGGFDMPERLDQQALPQRSASMPALAPERAGEAIAARPASPRRERLLIYGDGPFGDFYVARTSARAAAPGYRRARSSICTANPQVAAGVYRATRLAAMPLPTGSPAGLDADPARPRLV